MGFNKLIKKRYFNLTFTTPSHGQKFCILNKFKQFYKYDVSETDTHTPQLMLEEAEEFARKIYNTKATKFLTNGSTSGIISAVLSIVNANDKVLIWNGAHKSHLNAVKLAGAKPVFYDLPISEEFGVPLPFSNYKDYINDSIKAVIVTSPTYEGYVSDIKSIKETCQKYGTYLIVDEAHGALYPFSQNLPESSIKYADFTIQSLHKTAGGLNPTALLHINCNVDLKLDMISTTSPSYPLLMSIEKNIKYLNSSKGKKELEDLIKNLKEFRSSIKNYSFGGNDITKILIKKENLSGFELSDKLYNLGIEDEKTNAHSSLLITGIGTKKRKLDKLKLALKKI